MCSGIVISVGKNRNCIRHIDQKMRDRFASANVAPSACCCEDVFEASGNFIKLAAKIKTTTAVTPKLTPAPRQPCVAIR